MILPSSAKGGQFQSNVYCSNSLEVKVGGNRLALSNLTPNVIHFLGIPACQIVADIVCLVTVQIPV